MPHTNKSKIVCTDRKCKCRTNDKNKAKNNAAEILNAHEGAKSGVIMGCWSRPGIKSICPICKSEMIDCPREGHRNSEFWKFQKPDGCLLTVCPNGCLEN